MLHDDRPYGIYAFLAIMSAITISGVFWGQSRLLSIIVFVILATMFYLIQELVHLPTHNNVTFASLEMGKHGFLIESLNKVAMVTITRHEHGNITWQRQILPREFAYNSDFTSLQLFESSVRSTCKPGSALVLVNVHTEQYL